MKTSIIMSKKDRDSKRLHLLDMFNKSNYNSMFYQSVTNNIIVTRSGNIKNADTGTVYKQYLNSNGYAMVNLKIRGKGRRSVMAHRAVAETFYPYLGLNNYFYEVNHIDGNKLNNSIENLEWVTREENLDHARKTRLFKNNKRKSTIFSDQDKEDIMEFIQLGYSRRELARHYNCKAGIMEYTVRRLFNEQNNNNT